MSIRVMKLVLFALVLLSSAVSSYCYFIIYLDNELAALHTILGDWNQSTPSVSTNLPGWSSQNPYPCFSDAWKGVLCVQYPIANSSNRWSFVVGLSLDDASIVGTLPPAIGDLTNLVVLSLTNNPGLTGPIPAEINNLAVLQILDLHNNNFNGTIPEFTNLGNLQELNLSMNNFYGPIDPASIFHASSNLKVLDLSRNNFSGPLPNMSLLSTSLQQFNKNTRKVIIISTIVSGIVLILDIAITTCLFWKRFAQHEVQPTIFGYTELKMATRDFHPSMKLGEGSFGVVYKGILANGVKVAIKQLSMKTQKNIDEFLNEVVTINGVKHRNLVKLKGYCLRDNTKLLVYEYLENGDLTNLLFGGQNGKEVLFWPTRFNICLGIARGLHYLHEISQPRIIHRDIKASNILLDKMLQPKIADFGLAFLFPDDKTHITTTHVAGTKGYLAPEYATLGQLTIKVDVYSFGVLLLEIISGRKNIDDNLALGDKYLVEKAWRLHREGNLIDIVDQNLHLLNDETIQAQQLLNITLLCLLNDGERRPSMARVVAMLQGEPQPEPQHNGFKEVHQYEHDQRGSDSSLSSSHPITILLLNER
ncbi:unnamed protein product [Sphagnum troendelagicum]|uniref:Protein kinase domain-containing protein n=1 Tax=Sphagnum troendelagicum TaxID=128251 RepID=A0ABP0V2E3_9BRYO